MKIPGGKKHHKGGKHHKGEHKGEHKGKGKHHKGKENPAGGAATGPAAATGAMDATAASPNAPAAAGAAPPTDVASKAARRNVEMLQSQQREGEEGRPEAMGLSRGAQEHERERPGHAQHLGYDGWVRDGSAY